MHRHDMAGTLASIYIYIYIYINIYIYTVEPRLSESPLS